MSLLTTTPQASWGFVLTVCVALVLLLVAGAVVSGSWKGKL